MVEGPKEYRCLVPRSQLYLIGGIYTTILLKLSRLVHGTLYVFSQHIFHKLQALGEGNEDIRMHIAVGVHLDLSSEGAYEVIVVEVLVVKILICEGRDDTISPNQE